MPRADAPVVLVETVAGRQLAAAVSAEAAARGIRAGMTLAEARALCPDLLHAPLDQARDVLALEALGRWMMRFSPSVAIDAGAGVRPAGRRKPTPSGYSPYCHAAVFLDVTGCELLYGGLANLTARVEQAMRALCIRARIATAPTVGAAYALAAYGSRSGVIAGAAELHEAIAPLPPEALRIAGEDALPLHQLGIHTVGQLVAMPRDQLAARFGPDLLKRIDQAMGRAEEPLAFIRWEAPVAAAADFDAPPASLEAIWTVIRRLVGQIAADLHRRGRGARAMELELRPAEGPVITKNVLLSSASRDPVRLFVLLRSAVESILEEAARREAARAGPHCNRSGANVRDGFTGIRLSVPLAERLGERQMMLTGADESDAWAELEHLLEKLLVRLGDRAVVRARLIESHIPEKACAAASVCHVPPARVSHAGRVAGRAGDVAAPSHEYVSERWRWRPLCLLPEPEEIRVMVSPSHDRDGRPAAITRGDAVYRVVHAAGPERIAGRWWEGHNRTRDYFIVETDDGVRWWVFRVRETGRWYIHGQFC